MLNKLKKLQAEKQSSKGFTIIEVMIVLAIAGLIILIVFLAVPALQRNSRNTQRKSDVGRTGSAATTLVSNANGAVTSTNFNSPKLQAEVGTPGYYVLANITANIITSGTVTNATTKDKIVVVYGGKCSGVDATFSNRQIAVLYATETGGTDNKTCVDQ